LQALHPHDIQSDILRLQQNIINSLRTLNAQHDQLEYIHALLGELNRLQQASGIAAANGQELPNIAPLNPPFGLAPMTPQAYFSNGPVLRQGDAGLPPGLVLPEGWTLRPLAPAPQPADIGIQNLVPSHPGPSAPQATQSTTVAPPSIPNDDGQARASESSPSSSGFPAASGTDGGPSSKTAEPSSLESSWSFGNVAGGNDVAEGSSSAVAGSSAEASRVTRRTATVEDAEDNGE
jgi:E3 ubiquitin-protein ligase synoviolin